ncbi:hypothetical protein O181_008518 [Austropuccinia psidii MF-1]|uniref:Integrase zinc-binding domain-containing protein n=1 Tax=Austropuccinia psidii MF-1 TaxID=1389203 RepID=A0A9Q3GIK5_9BASI|nr:hypothetical protein [Austropuccinia psidii MF-1]
MTVVFKSQNIHKGADVLSRWAVADILENPAWVSQEEHHIEGICVTEIGAELFNKVQKCYNMDKDFHILCQLLMKAFKDPLISSKVDEIWKKAYDEGRLNLLDGALYHRNKKTCVFTLKDRPLINTIPNEFHDSVVYGHLSEDSTLKRVKTCSWWPNLRHGVAEYCRAYDIFQKANRATGKKYKIFMSYIKSQYFLR